MGLEISLDEFGSFQSLRRNYFYVSFKASSNFICTKFSRLYQRWFTLFHEARWNTFMGSCSGERKKWYDLGARKGWETSVLRWKAFEKANSESLYHLHIKYIEGKGEQVKTLGPLSFSAWEINQYGIVVCSACMLSNRENPCGISPSSYIFFSLFYKFRWLDTSSFAPHTIKTSRYEVINLHVASLLAKHPH